MVKLRKTRIKRSFLWKIPKNELTEKVRNSTSISEVLRAYGLKNKGGNSHTLKRRLLEEKIDFSHIQLGVNSNKGRKFPFSSMTREEVLKLVFIEQSPYGRSTVKLYLKKYDFIPYQCECGLKNEWRDKPLHLQLEHRNGVPNDHRIHNLEWICPNCHSQTPTFAGKKHRKHSYCETCHAEIKGFGKQCRGCVSTGRRKVERPSKETLAEELIDMSFVAVGKKHGVSDNTIRQWCKQYGF